MRREKQEKLSKSAASGLVALVFLILGFQLALFVVKVVERPARCPVEPGITQDVEPAGNVVSPPAPTGGLTNDSAPKRSKYGGYERPASPAAPKRTRPREPERSYESFAFDPNTVSLADLQRLGLSERQAQSIENYREKGGRFRSKADFRKMYVVSDTLFARLEPYIEIAKLELNGADSAALVSLRGIGPWYARKILDYRDRLGGFVAPEQLLEIDGIDAERYAGFADGITVDPSRIRQRYRPGPPPVPRPQRRPQYRPLPRTLRLHPLDPPRSRHRTRPFPRKY